MIDIPVIYSFARSGGTLVNQLLGVYPNHRVGIDELNSMLLKHEHVKSFSV